MKFNPQSPETTGYHIFLEPENQLRKKIQNIINNLSEEYSGPVFTPHVTLLARIQGDSDTEVIEKTKLLAQQMKAFSISLAGIDSRPAYFQACFLQLVNEALVVKYHERAKAIFGVIAQNTYMPHMSLFYGNLTKEQSGQIISEVDLSADRLEFKVDALHVYRTPGAVETWEKIGEISI